MTDASMSLGAVTYPRTMDSKRTTLGLAGIASAARRKDLAAWWVMADGTLEMTPAARQRTTRVAIEA